MRGATGEFRPSIGGWTRFRVVRGEPLAARAPRFLGRVQGIASIKLGWRKGLVGFFVMMLALARSSGAQAAPTQEEVFQSINQNVGSTVDMSKVVPIALMALAVVILLFLFNKRRQRIAVPKAINHPGKLARQLAKGLHLRPAEIKQLKLLAEQQKIENPITLLLCPSILAKAIRASDAKIDKKVVNHIVQRLRGLAPAQTPPSTTSQPD